MIKNKHITAIVAVAMAIAVLISMGMFFGAGTYTGKTTEYQTKLFNGEVVEINIEVDENEWNDLLENATAKEYVAADVTLNGDTFSSVGIRTKGNSSLTQVASSDSDRYSLQLNPNKYVKGQSFYGLDNLCINNIVSDSTYMKDSISYDIMEYLGVPTPLRNYARVTVNGEYYGLCLLLERYDNSFLDRTYNSTTGELYNVKMGFGGMGGDKENADANFPANDGGMPTMPTQNNDSIASESSSAASESSQSVASQAATNTGQPNATQQPPTMPEGGMPNFAANGEPPEIPENGTMPTPPNGEMPTGEQAITAQPQSGQTTSKQQAENTTNSTSSEQTTSASDTQQAANTPTMPENNNQGGGFGGPNGGFGGGMFGSSSGGGSLVYTDDDPESYSSIFDNAVSNKVSDKDKEQVITAIQKLNEGEDLEKYWDVDEVLRYFAAHTFVVNLDSYVSNMQQNYYLLEKNGQMTILPWDYNLAFGGFNSGSASEVINFPIDTPVSGVSMEDRPLLNELLSVPEYSEKYHEYLNDIVEGYVQSGLFQEEVDRINNEIGSYVQEDTTGFYTYEEYITGIEELINVVNLRAESVAGQLDGTIPSTSEGQQQDSSTLIDASSVTLSKLGTQGGGGGGGMGNMQKPGERSQTNTQTDTDQQTDGTQANTNETTTEQQPATEETQTSTQTQVAGGRGNGQPQNNQSNMGADQFQMLQELQQAAIDGTLTEEQKEQLAELGITEEQLVEFSEIMGGNGGMPNMQGIPGMNGGQSTAEQTVVLTGKDWAVYGVLALLLIGGILFMAKYPKYRHKK